jgi:hypothetical protein
MAAGKDKASLLVGRRARVLKNSRSSEVSCGKKKSNSAAAPHDDRRDAMLLRPGRGEQFADMSEAPSAAEVGGIEPDSRKGE